MGSGSSKKSNRQVEKERQTHTTFIRDIEESEGATADNPSMPPAEKCRGQSVTTNAGASAGQGDGGLNAKRAGAAAKATEMENRVELVLCKEGDLKNGEMREFTVEEAKVLLVKDKGQFYAIGGKCTHYGAPLAKGAYSNGIVRCPWHGACFNVETGDIEDFPGLDSLPRFQIDVNNGDVKLSAIRKDLLQCKRTKPMCLMNEGVSKNEVVVIVGGGGAAASCAEALRQNNFAGRIIMITQEMSLPYDRPKLSKALGTDAEALQLRPMEFYEKNRIEVNMGQPVSGINREKKLVLLADESTRSYKYLVLATGGRPRTLTCAGYDLNNIFYLRFPVNGRTMASAIVNKHVVIVGSSFIGMEVASCAVGKNAASVTVIGQHQTPYFRTFGAEIGAALKQLFISKGVKFEMPAEIDRLVGDAKGNLKEVVLQSGKVVNADVLVVGIGVEPETSFLRDSGIETDYRGYIPVNSHMQTNDPFVYACGDIAVFPLSSFENKLVNIQHWQMALKHGKTAGQAIAGRAEDIKTVPFFWTVLFGKSLRFTGYSAGYDKTFIRGSLDELQFVAYFLKKDKLVAVATLGRDPVASQIAECFRSGRPISISDIDKNESDDWSHFLTWTHL